MRTGICRRKVTLPVSRRKVSAGFPTARTIHESHPLHALRRPRRSRIQGPARSGAGSRRGRGGGEIRCAQLLRHADHRRQVPGQAALPVLAGLRIRRRGGERRRGRDGTCRRRPRARLWRLRGGAREGADRRATRGEDPRHARFRPRRRRHGDLRHDAARAEGPRPAQIRRDARGARRLRRHRARRDRDRQADGRARDRLRVVRRQACLLPRTRGRRRRSITQRKT